MKFKNFLFLIKAHLRITWDILDDSITKKTFTSKKFGRLEKRDWKKNSNPFRPTSAPKISNQKNRVTELIIPKLN